MFALAAVLPVLAPIALGAAARRAIPDADAYEQVLSDAAYRFFGPPLIFAAVYLAPDGIIGFGLGALIALVAGAILAAIAVGLFEHWAAGCDAGAATARGVTAAFGNSIYFGIPLSVAVLGPEAAGPAAVLAVTSNFVLVPVSTFALIASGRGRWTRAVAASVVRRTVSAPLVWPMPLALVLQALRVPLPGPIVDAIALLAAVSAPLALFALGLAIGGRHAPVTGFERPGLWRIVAVKLLAAPLIVATLANVFSGGVWDVWAAAAVVVAATPTAVTAHMLVTAYQPQALAARRAVAATTLAAAPAAVILAHILS